SGGLIDDRGAAARNAALVRGLPGALGKTAGELMYYAKNPGELSAEQAGALAGNALLSWAPGSRLLRGSSLLSIEAGMDTRLLARDAAETFGPRLDRLAEQSTPGLRMYAVQEGRVVPSKGLLVQSSDGVVLDMFGSNISPRTQSILDKFSDARRVLVEDAGGKQSVVNIVDNLGRREVKVSDLGRLQAATGNEFSLLRGPEGQRVLLQGDPTQMMIPEQYVGNGWKWSGHSHPYGIDPSSSDRFVLRAFQQEQSIIKSAADGRQKSFTQFEDWSSWLPGM
ncbi:hypothetical protein LQT98_11160, partial [Chromobacterium aquaticum]